jgi:hypothetical protein
MNNPNLECVDTIKDTRIESNEEISIDTTKKEWKRNCPKCNTELSYSSYDLWWRANKINSRCKSCSKKGMPNGRLGKKHTEISKQKISSSNVGKKLTEEAKKKMSNAWIKRKINYPITKETREKMSKSFKGRKFSDNHKLNLSKSNTGKKRTEETKYKNRLATVNDLFKKGIIGKSINHNPRACEFIDKLNKEKGWNLQHAENGGEIELYGYLVDGYDKERNIIFEYDEPHHNKLNKKQKDLVRQRRLLEIIKPNMFVRFDEENNKLYDIKTNQNILSI